MAWPRSRWVAMVAVLAAPACGLRDVGGPPGEEQVVVQGVLAAEASEQVLWIERTTAAGQPIGPGLRPLVAPPTRVEVRDTSGAIFAFHPDPTSPARFVATFTPVHGQRYDLLVEAGAWVVRGSAVMPGRLTIVEPAADTVSVPQDSELRIQWGSGSSPWVAIYVTPTSVADLDHHPRVVRGDTSFLFSRFSFFDTTTIVSVRALDSVTARVVDPLRAGDFSGVLAGNLTGGAGFFGATSGDQLVVRRQ